MDRSRQRKASETFHLLLYLNNPLQKTIVMPYNSTAAVRYNHNVYSRAVRTCLPNFRNPTPPTLLLAITGSLISASSSEWPRSWQSSCTEVSKYLT